MKRKMKFILAATAAMLISFAAADVNAQSGSRPSGSGSRGSGSGSRAQAPSAGFNAQGPQIPGQQGGPQDPNGTQYTPILGSGLIGAEERGCNCFRLPDFDPNPPEPYDIYSSNNYWDLCPPTTQGNNRSSNCGQPRIDFNRFIPRPNQRLFGR